jgi:branched-chain amino acid transport system permease protein
VLALPTVRLRGIFLTLASIAFALLVENVVFTRDNFTGGVAGKALPRPGGFTSDFMYFILLTAVFCVLGFLCERFQYSPVGLELQAELGSNPGAQSIGIRPDKGRVIAFTLSAALAGLGGTFLGAQAGFLSPSTWGLIPASVWLVLVASGGLGSTAMMVQVGVIVSILPALVEAHIPALGGQSYVALFGVLGLLVLRVPGGAVGIEERLAARIGNLFRRRPTSPPGAGVTEATAPVKGEPSGPAVAMIGSPRSHGHQSP